MGILSNIHLLFTFVHLSAGVYVIWLDRRSLENISTGLVLICFAIWSCGHILTHNIYTTKDVAFTGRLVGSIGWIIFAPATFFSFLVFTEKTRIYKNILVVLLVSVIPVALLTVQFSSHDLTKDMVLTRYGWQPVWAGTFWTPLFFCQLLLFITTSFVIVINFMQRTTNVIKKHHANTVLIVGVTIFFLGFLSAIIHAYIMIDLPTFEAYGGIFWTMAVLYSIRKYKYLVPLPDTDVESSS